MQTPGCSLRYAQRLDFQQLTQRYILISIIYQWINHLIFIIKNSYYYYCRCRSQISDIVINRGEPLVLENTTKGWDNIFTCEW